MSHTDNKRLFVLKALTLERLGVLAWLKKFAYCGQVPRLSFLHYGFVQVIQAKEKSTEFAQTDSQYTFLWMKEAGQSQ